MGGLGWAALLALLGVWLDMVRVHWHLALHCIAFVCILRRRLACLLAAVVGVLLWGVLGCVVFVACASLPSLLSLAWQEGVKGGFVPLWRVKREVW